jgi:hypothetical protein
MNAPASRTAALVRTLAVTALLACAGAQAQDFNAMIQQQMNAMNQNIANAQQHVNGIVQQRMHDPAVQASYRQYLARMQQTGQRPMDYPTFTYNYVYTNGFSAQGMAHARANEANIGAKERAAVQGVRDAERNRGAAMQQQQQSYFNNQQEAGRQLMGNSTFTAPNGSQTVLPHTWQNNSSHRYQGNNYHVDTSGQYWVQAANGYWYALKR